MGNRLGRPRRGLPERARALKPGAALSDVRDRDVVVLCADGAPLRLDVVADDGSPLGNAGAATDPGTPRADASASRSAPARPRRSRTRAAASSWTRADPGSPSAPSSPGTITSASTTTVPWIRPRRRRRIIRRIIRTLAGAFPALVRFRHRRHVPRLGLWSWSYDAPADAVVFSSKSDPRVRCLAVGPARSFSRADAARRWTETLRDERDVLGAVAKALRDLEAEARDVASEALGRLEAMKRHLEREIARERRRAATKGTRGGVGVPRRAHGGRRRAQGPGEGASAEPIGPTERDEEEEEEEESAAVVEKDVASKGGARRRVAFEDGRGGGARARVAAAREEGRLRRVARRDRLGAPGDGVAPVGLERGGFPRRARGARRGREAARGSSGGDPELGVRTLRRAGHAPLPPQRKRNDRRGRDDDERSVSDAAYGSETESFFSESDDVSASAASPSRKGGSTRWASQVSEDAARLARARRARARRRAELKARVRAGEAAVDFRRHKVGSLREQLERQGVDAGPPRRSCTSWRESFARGEARGSGAWAWGRRCPGSRPRRRARRA